MQTVALVLAFLACVGHARRVQMTSETKKDTFDASSALAALLRASEQPSAFAHSAPSPRFHPSSRPVVSQRRNQVRMEETEVSEKATTIAAAVIGGLIGKQFFETDLLWTAIWCLLFAYLSTYSTGVGSYVKKAGVFGAKAYDKTLEVNEEYDILPKAKGAVDTVLGVADNLNKNYGITDSLDAKLAISEKVEGVKAKVDDVKSSITSKVDDLKSNALEAN